MPYQCLSFSLWSVPQRMLSMDDDPEIPNEDYNTSSAVHMLERVRAQSSSKENQSSTGEEEKEPEIQELRLSEDGAGDDEDLDFPVEHKENPESPRIKEESKMDGLLEFRKKRRFSVKKEWKTRQFILNSRSLVYFDRKQMGKKGKSISLLGASVSTWRTYKDDKQIAKSGGSEEEYSQSKSNSKSAPIQKGWTKPIELAPDRTFVVITNSSQVYYIRCPSIADRDKWVGAIIMVVIGLKSKFTPQAKSLGVDLNVVNYKRTFPSEAVSFQIEGITGDLTWTFWRSYEELESFHQDVLKFIFDKTVLPDLLPYPKEESEIENFVKNTRVYMETITRIEAVAPSPRFLEFIGMVDKKPDPQNPSISIADAQEICQTGDLVLVANSRRTSPKLSKTDWSHIGIVIGISGKNVANKDQSFFLMEATASDGYKLHPLNSRLQELCGESTVGFRKLDWSNVRNLSALVRLSEFVKIVQEKKYPTNANDSGNVSSQLVTECYILMGILPESSRSKDYSPGDFSGAGKSLPFVRGVFFTSEESLISFKEIQTAKSSSNEQ
jgi:hypothetical protein